MSENTPTVLIVDDDDGMRRSLARLLKSAGIPSRTFASAAEFLAGYDSAQAGCIVLDVRMDGTNGLDLQQMLVDDRVLTPIIMISGHADVPTAVRSMKTGAVEFIEKPFEQERFLAAIRTAFRTDARNRSDDALRNDVLASIERLTARERDLLPHLLQGRSAKQIAIALGISPKTAHIHLGRILDKLGVENAVELGNLMHTTELFNEVLAGNRPETQADAQKEQRPIPS